MDTGFAFADYPNHHNNVEMKDFTRDDIFSIKNIQKHPYLDG
jgi:hypothetical protein